MRQYFVPGELEIGKEAELDERSSHHLKNVLRADNGDKIRLVDSLGHPFIAEVRLDNGVKAIVRERLHDQDRENAITICAALVKKDKWELMIQKAAELGADRIIPVITHRTVIHIDEKDISRKVERWNMIALAASQQSNRNTITAVLPPVKLTELEKYKSNVNLAAYEKENSRHISEFDLNQDLTVIFGPEGGFESSEAAALNRMGYQSCHLGKRILRAETAVMYALSAIDVKRYQ